MMAECLNHQENALIQAQTQDKQQRSLEASKQMVYDVFCFIIGLLEELETRELTGYGKEQLEKSNIRLPDQTKKMDEDVEAIIQIEILALSYQLKCFDSGSRKALRQQLRDITRAWVIPREGWQLKSKAYVDSLFEVLYNRTYTLEKNRVEKCDSFSDEEIQGLLIANEQCYILDEAFKSDPDKKAALPYIRKADQLSPAYSDIGSSVDPPCESMEVDDHFSSSITTPDVQSQQQQNIIVQPQNQFQQENAVIQSMDIKKQHSGKSGFKISIPSVQAQVHQNIKAQPQKKGHHRQTNSSIRQADQMTTERPKVSIFFVRCHMINDEVVGFCIQNEVKTYDFDEKTFPEMMKHGSLKDFFHLKTSPLKVFIGDISVISKSLFQTYRVALDGTNVDSFNFALDKAQPEQREMGIQRACEFKNITHEELCKMYQDFVRKIEIGQGRHEYKRKLFEFINLRIDNKQLLEVTNKRTEERKNEKMKKKKTSTQV